MTITSQHYNEFFAIIIILYLTRSIVGVKKSPDQRIRNMSFSLVNFLNLSFICFVVCLIISDATGAFTPKILHYFAFTWFNLSVSVTTLILYKNLYVKSSILFYLITITIFGFSNNMDFHKVFNELNNITKCGFIIDDTTSCGESAQNESAHVFATFITSFYYLIGLSIIFQFYGRIIRIKHEGAIERQEKTAIDRRSIDTTFDILSVGIAAILALILAGGHVPSVTIFSGLVIGGLAVALKDLLNNLFSGLILIWDRSVKPDAVILTPSGKRARIFKMSMRYIATVDRDDLITIIPNSYFNSNPIESLTQNRRHIRLRVTVHIPYCANPEETMSELQDSISNLGRVVNDEPTRVVIKDFSELGILLEARFWINNPEDGTGNIEAGVRLEIFETLRKSGIDIPFPNHNIRFLPPNT